jgi:phosphoadenosine phosphosulfate reductase
MQLIVNDVQKYLDLKHATAEDTLRWALTSFGDRIAIASSFGAEDVVLIDMAVRIDQAVKIFTLDTGRLHRYVSLIKIKFRKWLKTMDSTPFTKAQT